MALVYRLSFLFVGIVCLSVSVFAQSKAVEQYQILAETKPGIYTGFNQFKSNNPILLNWIANEYGFGEKQYLYSLKKSQIVQYHDAYGIKRTLSASDLWGYCTGDDIYINVGIGFAKLEIIGSLSLFIADVIVELPPISASFETQNTRISNEPRYSYEKKQFILDTETGIYYEATVNNFEAIIKSDSVLSREYEQLKSKEAVAKIIPMLLEYNRKHPFSFAN